MQIKWIFEDLEPGQIRRPVATSEDGNYQIVFESYYNYSFYYYLYRNSDCIYACKVCTIDHFDFSEFLVKCHRKIERWEDRIRSGHRCGNCNHLIFRDYRHCEGMCGIVRLHRNFEDTCIHQEEIT